MIVSTPAQITRDDIVSNKEYVQLASALRTVYVGRGTDVAVATKLKDLLSLRAVWSASQDRAAEDPCAGQTTAGTRYECRAVVLTGESGAGKSRLMHRTLSEYALTPNANSLPILSLQVPGPCTLMTLGHALLERLGYPVNDHVKEHVVWRHVRRQLALARADVLHLDEVQNVTTTANRKEATKILNSLRAHLIDERHPVILLLSGLPEITPFLASDPQIRRRADFLNLESLDLGDVALLNDVLLKLTRKAHLDCDRDDKELLPRLIHASCRQYGLAIDFCVEAILRAVRPLDDRGRPMPRERCLARRHFAAEFAARSGNAPFANVFLAPAPDWYHIDPTLVGVTHPVQVMKKPEPPLKPGRRRSVDTVRSGK